MMPRVITYLTSPMSQRVGHNWATELTDDAEWSFPGGSDAKQSACNVGDLA